MVINAEILDELVLSEFYWLMNVDIIDEGLKLIPFVLIVKLEYSNHRR